jgi:hypothetical protein
MSVLYSVGGATVLVPRYSRHGRAQQSGAFLRHDPRDPTRKRGAIVTFVEGAQSPARFPARP